MTRLFRSRSCGRAVEMGFDHTPRGDSSVSNYDEETEDGDEEEEGEYEEEMDREDASKNQGFIRTGGNTGRSHQVAVLDTLVAALRKSLVTCSVEEEEAEETDDDVVGIKEISWPTEVRHVSHVTFDRFDGFLGLPSEFQPEVPNKAPSASASVFGVSVKSMQCSYDNRGNSVPTILLMMQKQLYSAGGLKAEGIFRINAENSQELCVREQLNKGMVPHEIDVHCLAGLIKAWFRELPGGVLDSLAPEQVMRCNTEEDCVRLVELLPPTEGALLDWAIDLMTDVAQDEAQNKMNARNIAMVFAPNMTQMDDPLTALIHAVQVMNFLKMLVLKRLRERETDLASVPSSSSERTGYDEEQPDKASTKSGNCCIETVSEEGCCEYEEEEEEEGEDEMESVSGRSTCTQATARMVKSRRMDWKGSGSGNGHAEWLRKGVWKLCRHPVFQLSRASKRARTLRIVSSREGGREAQA